MSSNTKSEIIRFRRSQWRFVVSISGGGSAFISDYLTESGASATFLEALVPYSQDATDEFLGGAPEQYCSEPTARRLASQALRRAVELEDRAARRLGGQYVSAPLVGIGVTASLASNRPKKGGRRAYCAIQSRLGTFSATLTLNNGARSREDEERLTADFILSTLNFAVDAVEKRLGEVGRVERAPLPLATSIAQEPDDAASISWTRPDAGVAALLFDRDNAEIAALRFFQGKVDLVRDRFGKERAVDSSASDAVSPTRAIYPGSFNPPHRGHVAVAKLASQRFGLPVELELSAHNVDKPALDPLELAARLEAIEKAFPNAPLWISNAPRYVEKAAIFPNAKFVMGTDTVLRLADPKYENNSIERRDSVLAQIKDLGIAICVFARKVKGELLSAERLDQELPDALRSLCDFVPADVFLDDVSSSAIRNAK